MKKLSALSFRRCALAVFLVSALLTGFFALCSPLFTDDLDFAAQHFSSFSALLHYCLHYGNGRLLGNLGAAIFCDHTALRTVVRALCIGSLTVLLPLAAGAEDKRSLLLSFLLVFGVSPDLFAETYAWSSGFQNYIPPVVFLLVCLILWQRSERFSHRKLVFACVGTFVLAAAAQLYVELNSLIHVLAALVLLCLSRSRAKKSVSLCALAGTALGGAVMIAIPKLFEREYALIAFYRRIYLSSLSEMFGSLWKNGLKLTGFFVGDCFLCLLLGVGVFLLLRQNAPRAARPGWHRAASVLSLALPVYSLLYRAFFSGWSAVWLADIQKLFFALLLLAFLAAFVYALTLTENKARRTAAIVLLALAVCSLAPMTVVYPAPVRTIYLCYTFLALAALIVWEEVLPRSSALFRRDTAVLGLLAAVLLSLLLVFQFLNIRHVDRLNTDYIEKKLAEGSTEIELIRTPSDYVFKNTSSYLGHYYFLSEPNDVDFTFTDYDSWVAKRQLEENRKN